MKSQQVCLTCGYVGSKKSYARGSFGSELGLWMFGLVLLVVIPPVGALVLIVALFYSLWRVFCKYKGCAICKSETLVPQDSPAAQTMARRALRED